MHLDVLKKYYNLFLNFILKTAAIIREINIGFYFFFFLASVSTMVSFVYISFANVFFSLKSL